MEENIKTAEAAQKDENIVVRQGKELTIENDWENGDDLLYYGGRRIYLSQLEQKMSWEELGYSSPDGSYLPLNYGFNYDDGYTGIRCEYETGEGDNSLNISLESIVNGDCVIEWDEAKIGEMVKKYGYKFDQAKRAAEIADRKKEEEEFEASVKGEKVQVDCVNGNYLLCYGARQVFDLTLRYSRMRDIDYIISDIDPDEYWDEDYINNHKPEFQKLVQKFGVVDAYSIYPC